jgi:hypothetical protein
MSLKTSEKGTVVAFSSGEYSDYHYKGMFVVLKDFTEEVKISIVDKLTKDWNIREGQNLEDDLSYDLDDYLTSSFLGEAVRQGYLLDLDYTVYHLDNYGDFRL